jgi:hypothetical protein
MAMKPLSRILVLGWAALIAAAGCGGVTLQPPDGGSNAGHGGGGNAGGSAGFGGAGGDAGSMGGHVGSAGQDGGGGGGGAPVCSGLDQSQCSATPGCAVLACPTCSGQTVFSKCYRAEGAPPPSCVPLGCPAPESCHSLGEIACQGRSDCQTEHCASCDGGVGFAGCIASGEPAVQCPAACLGAPCSQLSEGLCKSRSDCTPEYCPTCSGGQTFVGCAAPGGVGVACGLDCPAPAPCANVTTLAACDARTDCHSVFVDPATCGCNAVGCCAHFSRCADGGKALCTGTPLCKIVTPYCEAPAYVVSYTASCYEGCVRPTECAP